MRRSCMILAVLLVLGAMLGCRAAVTTARIRRLIPSPGRVLFLDFHGEARSAPDCVAGSHRHRTARLWFVDGTTGAQYRE